MKTMPLSCATILLALGFGAIPAQARPHTFVSSSGGGTACTATAPCADFQTAHNATDDGGKIGCVDSGNFVGSTTITITKSITIDCSGTAGTALVTAADGFLIATAGVTVRFRHLTIEGKGASISNGIRFTNGAALIVEDCVIANFTAGNSTGLAFAPVVGVTAKLFIIDSVFSNNSLTSGGFGVGIEIASAQSGSTFALLDGVRLEGNRTAIDAFSDNNSQAAVQVRNSVIANGGQGVFADSVPGSVTSVTLDHTSSLLNSGAGIRASGSSTFILLGKSTVISNGTGLQANGGNIFSYQDNQLTGNITDGAPTGVLTLQ